MSTPPEKRQHKETFHEVLYNWDDQVIVRILVEQFMPEEAQKIIVDRFNQHVDRVNAILAAQQSAKTA